MQQANAASPFGLLVVIALAMVAISGSDKRWRTTLFIFGWTALGLAVGTGVGLLMGSAGAAGSLAGGLTLLMGAGTSIIKISENRKAKARFIR